MLILMILKYVAILMGGILLSLGFILLMLKSINKYKSERTIVDTMIVIGCFILLLTIGILMSSAYLKIVLTLAI